VLTKEAEKKTIFKVKLEKSKSAQTKILNATVSYTNINIYIYIYTMENQVLMKSTLVTMKKENHHWRERRT